MNQVDRRPRRRPASRSRNVPFCVDEVSDHALTLLLAAERRLILLPTRPGPATWDVAESPEYRQIRRLRGQTLGSSGPAGSAGSWPARPAPSGFARWPTTPTSTTTGDPELPLMPLNEVLGQADAVVTCASL